MAPPRSGGLLPCVLLLFLVNVGPVDAKIETVHINNDPRAVFHVEEFGFETGGLFKFALREFVLMVPESYVKPTDQHYNIAFVLQRSEDKQIMDPTDTDNDERKENDNERFCFHEQALSETGDDLVISVSQRENWKAVDLEQTIVEPGRYRLYFSNCEPYTHATFELTLTEYNIDPATGKKLYLGTGEAVIPSILFVLGALFFVQLGAWSAYLFRQNKEDIRSIHYLMALVVLLKVLTIFFEAGRYHTLLLTGGEDAWATLYYIFASLKGMLMFGVIILIGTGWSFLKPFLTERDKQIILVVIVVQAMVNVAVVVVEETAPGEYSWITWRDALHLLDMISCVAILLPIVWSIRHLKEAASVDGKALRNMDRLRNFRSFYLVVVAYIYFTRIIVYLLGAMLSADLAYLEMVFAEAASLVFYAFTGYLFRPQPRNPYIAIQRDDDDLEMDSFDTEPQVTPVE